MINDAVKATGSLLIEVKNTKGEVTNKYEVNNLVVSVGRSWIAARLKDTGSPTQMTHMAIGTGNTGAQPTDTALQNQVARVSLSTAGGSVSANQISFSATFPANTPATEAVLTEAGLFNAATSGTMLARTVFPVVTKQPSDSISITWTVSIN